MKLIRSLLCLVLLVATFVALGVGRAEARPATVTGADRVFVRRGPSVDFQAFSTVEKGQRVDVQGTTGDWALVKVPSGEQGYISGLYLVYLDGTPVAGNLAAPTATATAAGVAQVPTPAGVAVSAAAGLAQENAALKAKAEGLQQELDSLRKATTHPTPAADDIVALRAEVRRLADTTDALRSRLDSPGAGAVPLAFGGGEQWSTPTVVVVGAVALLLGWLIGGGLARREERNKRTRIRF
jgi:Bacterial SH3 domain